MRYITTYPSLIGDIKLISDGVNLTHLYIQGQKHKIKFNNYIPNDNLEIFHMTKKWLDEYFMGNIPKTELKIKVSGTEFQKEVWNILKTIPYGTTTTYKNIAGTIAQKRNINKMSAQAVGCAIKNNPINIIIPCHRVIGTDGNLIGYNGGIELKIKLLKIEKIIK